MKKFVFVVKMVDGEYRSISGTSFSYSEDIVNIYDRSELKFFIHITSIRFIEICEARHDN